MSEGKAEGKWEGKEKPKEPFICRKCHQVCVTRYFWDGITFLAVWGWCDCTKGYEARYLYPEWGEAYRADYSPALPQSVPVSEHRAHCPHCDLPVLKSYRWISAGGREWLNAGSSLCGCVDRTGGYEAVNKEWAALTAGKKTVVEGMVQAGEVAGEIISEVQDGLPPAQPDSAGEDFLDPGMGVPQSGGGA